MKSYTLLVILFSFVYFSCTPPEAVRLQEYSERPEPGYFAHIPVGLNEYALALGESVDETEWRIGKRIDLTETQNDHIKLSRFVIRHAKLDADTTVTCGFRNGRLSAVLATTTFTNTIEQGDKFVEKLVPIFSFLPELKENLKLNKSSEYIKTDQVYSCRFNFKKTSNGFSGFEYLISYTNHVNTFDEIFNS